MGGLSLFGGTDDRVIGRRFYELWEIKKQTGTLKDRVGYSALSVSFHSR